MSTNSYSVYLAGPISGIDFEEGEGWRQEAINYLTPRDIDCFSPLRKKNYLKDQGHLTGTFEDWPLSTQRGIYARDRFDCHRVDVVLANLLDSGAYDNGTQRVSIGTVMEIAWAAQNNTPVVLIMEDGNIHRHPMLLEACPFVVDNLAEALDLTEAILRPSKVK
jgi:nucleoside 2-deoxyribosyltransferase